MRPVNPLYKRVIEYILLDFSFGYGVKPKKLLRTFLIVWILFSFYYVGFLRHKDKWILRWWQAWNPFRICFLWSLIHSFNILTPGIELYSLISLKASPYRFTQAESKKVIYVQRAQQILGWYLFTLFLILFGKVWIR
jgi:hypothetical protein